MSRPKAYTEHVSVRLQTALRQEIETHLADVGLGAALRDSTLRVIGREDLILEGRDESGHRKVAGAAAWKIVKVALTREQLAAIDLAAKGREISRSALMIQSLLFQLKMPPLEWSGRAWTFGKRRSSAPSRASKAPKKRARQAGR